MVSEWKEYSLNEVVELRNGAGIKQQFFSEEINAIPLIKVSNFTLDSVDTSDLTKVDSFHAERWQSHRLKTNDIVIATVGSWPPNWSSVVGKVVRIPQVAEGGIQNQNTCCIKPKSQIDGDFLYYLLRSKEFAEYIVNVAQGSANQARVPVKRIGEFKFSAPKAKVEQTKIGKILNSLDQKIDLNRNVNQTLEQMTQALFKSWFVDFDPVIDNALAAGKAIPDELQERAELRKTVIAQRATNPKLKPLPHNIQQLFPSEFEESDEPNIGKPKGWKFDSFSNIATLKTVSVHPNRNLEKVWTQFSLPAFDSGKTPTQDIGAEIKSGKYKVSESVVLVSKLNPNTPRIWLPKVIEPETSVCSTEFMPFEPIIKGQRTFIYSLMCSENVQSELASRVTGTTGSHQRVSPKNIAILPVILPSKSCIDLYCEMMRGVFSKIDLNIEQNIELTKIRDLLLPKLISGELELSQLPDKTN